MVLTFYDKGIKNSRMSMVDYFFICGKPKKNINNFCFIIDI